LSPRIVLDQIPVEDLLLHRLLKAVEDTPTGLLLVELRRLGGRQLNVVVHLGEEQQVAAALLRNHITK
jgi:hypothetical protein